MAERIDGIPLYYSDGSVEMAERVMTDRRLSSQERLVMSVFAAIASDTWDFVVSCAGIADAAGLPDEEVKQIVSGLVGAGRLRVNHTRASSDGVSWADWRWFEMYPDGSVDDRIAADDVLACLQYCDPSSDVMSDWPADLVSAPVVN